MATEAKTDSNSRFNWISKNKLKLTSISAICGVFAYYCYYRSQNKQQHRQQPDITSVNVDNLEKIFQSYFSHSRPNKISIYINQSITDSTTKSLANDNVFYYPLFFNNDNEMNIYKRLKLDFSKPKLIDFNVDMDSYSMIEYQTRKYKSDISDIFTIIIKILSLYFNVEPIYAQLNHYKNGNGSAQFHQDAHLRGCDITIGASFGFNDRIMKFRNVNKLSQIISIPQNNGDVYAFNKKFNDNFQHSIPKESAKECRPRFSVIIFGKKK